MQIKFVTFFLIQLFTGMKINYLVAIFMFAKRQFIHVYFNVLFVC